MPIYEYQGQHYDIATTDPAEAKRKILANLNPPADKKPTDYLKQFGQAAASVADTVLGAPAAIGQQLGYGVGRAFGLSPEEATASSLKITQPFMNPVGDAFGVTETPGYQSEVSRAVPAAAINKVSGPVSQVTGLPQQDVENMMGSAMLAAVPAAGRGAAAVGRGIYAAEPAMAAVARAPIAAAKAPFQFGKGAIEGVMNPEYQPATSAMVPLKDTYYPQAAVERYMGRMPGVKPQTLAQLESQARPTSELTNNTAAQLALKTVPKTAAGEPLVPLQGRGVEAWGERVGRGARTKPMQAMAEIGLSALTGIPFKTLGQAASGAASSYLGNKTGFAPGFTDTLQAARGQAGLQPSQQLALPAPGPVQPSPTTMYGGSGGVSPNLQQATQAALQQKYTPQLTPAAMAQQAAAAKIAPPTTPLQAAAQETVTQKAQRVMGDRYRAPVSEQPPPVAGPVAPAEPPPPAPPPTMAPVAPPPTMAPVVAPPPPVNTPAVKGPEIKSRNTPSNYDKLLNDVKGIAEEAVIDTKTGKIIAQRTFDAENKTITDPRGSPEVSPEIHKALPKKYEWEKSVEQWTPDGSDIAFTEYYTKTNKNAPAYKYVEQEASGAYELYKKENNNWSKIDTKTPTGVLNATDGRAAVQAAIDSGNKTTIKYKTSKGIVTEHVNQIINAKFDPDLKLTRRIDNPDGTTVMYGKQDSTGKPIKTVATAGLETDFIKVYDDTNPKSPVIISTYNTKGVKTSTSKKDK